MGIVADFLAIFKTKKLEKGKNVQLSRSQIVNIITNMVDAKKNLSSEQFDEVMKKFRYLRTHTYQTTYTLEDYLNEVINLIDTFDQIAPYEKYMSVSREKYTYLLNDLRSYQTSKYILNDLVNRAQKHGSFSGYTIGGVSFQFDSTLEENIASLINVYKDLSSNDVTSFLGIVLVAGKYDKQEALRRFKVYIDYLLSFSNNTPEAHQQIRSTLTTLCNLLTDYCLVLCMGGPVLYRKTPFTDEDCNELLEYFNEKLTAILVENGSALTTENVQLFLFHLVDAINPYSIDAKNNNEYIEYLSKNGADISPSNAKAFVGVLIAYKKYGKEKALELFHLYINSLFPPISEKRSSDLLETATIPTLCGVLVANNIISEEESTSLTDHFTDQLMVAVCKEKGWEMPESLCEFSNQASNIEAE